MTMNECHEGCYLRRGFSLVALVLALLACSLFLPGLGGGFVLDDGSSIVGNLQLRLARLNLDELIYAALSYSAGGRRTLPMASFALDYWRGGGLDAATFKATNLLIHAFTVVSLAFFFRRLLRLTGWQARQAAVAALVLAGVWAIHPLQVSAVLYVVQRMQTLCTLFVVLSLWAYLGMRQAQMEGRRSRGSDFMLVLSALLALLCKEDAALLPLYLLVLELTVLQFRAANPAVGKALRRGYGVLALLGAAAYFFVVVPHYWSWETNVGRVFSTPERVLTQGRVLVMYLGQILFPLPSIMPFHYDALPVSRGWWQPWTTLPAWLLLLALLICGWHLRRRRPLFSLGVLLFFAGHFMTSNVVNLELAFEHRNHFPLIGVILAVADLCHAAWQRWGVARSWQVLTLMGVLLALGAGTLVRAHAWGDPVRFARYSVALAADSPRAWLDLGSTYAARSSWQADSPDLARAIDALEEATEHVQSPTVLANLVLYKTIQGSVAPSDWRRLHAALRQVPATFQSNALVTTMVKNLRLGVPLDEVGVFEMFEIARARGGAGPDVCVLASHFAMDRNMPATVVLPFLRCAVAPTPASAQALAILSRRVKSNGRYVELAAELPVKP